MAKKIIKITYNPYDNHIKFIISLDSGKVWQELADTSELLKYQNQECVFSNCVEDIVSYINQYQNSSLEGLCIQFVGTGDDFSILEEVVKSENRNSNKKGKILTEYVGVYKSADESIEIIRSAYNRISSEFEDYLPGNKKYETNTSYAEIGDLINLFTATVSSDIPICVIGTYSVGKSAFINAIIGDEILPSKVDPCTAKDVKVESGTEVSFSIEYKGEPITYVINPGHIESRDEESEFAEEFRKAICEHCVFLGKNSNEILHDILIALNESEKTFPPIADVSFERQVVELPDGEKIEGVFPQFESIFDAKIPENLYLQPDRVQFRECNRQLAQEIENNLELRKLFSEEQLEQIMDGIYDGTAPDGYVWHHDSVAGKLQLVDFETHSRTGHTGGRSLWGGGSNNR